MQSMRPRRAMLVWPCESANCSGPESGRSPGPCQYSIGDSVARACAQLRQVPLRWSPAVLPDVLCLAKREITQVFGGFSGLQFRFFHSAFLTVAICPRVRYMQLARDCLRPFGRWCWTGRGSKPRRGDLRLEAHALCAPAPGP